MQHKIKAEIDALRNEITVKVNYYKGKKKVYQYNTAFPLGASEEEIMSEVEKAGKLFEDEKEKAKLQKEVDEKFDNANNLINKLNQC